MGERKQSTKKLSFELEPCDGGGRVLVLRSKGEHFLVFTIPEQEDPQFEILDEIASARIMRVISEGEWSLSKRDVEDLMGELEPIGLKATIWSLGLALDH